MWLTTVADSNCNNMLILNKSTFAGEITSNLFCRSTFWAYGDQRRPLTTEWWGNRCGTHTGPPAILRTRVWGWVFLLDPRFCPICILKLLRFYLGSILKFYPFWIKALFCIWALVCHFTPTSLKSDCTNWNWLTLAHSFGNRGCFTGAVQLSLCPDSFKTRLFF